ncbi:hypothetical protein ACWEWI_04780 [Streptomyces sp. NPDC003753]|uniref:Uncharacterized protein n=1 Tax=Streptomyces cynarae TaxID=2981134 RepID=A0ABY6EJK2_9ACTN|nr:MULTISPECIES: hypothetical protein [Streptomyces]UXY24838.1 hypothetical protein N8I84_14885 [Streptomyces cynarae]GHJ98976.1 hypothetical protein SY2F82_07740 [Streptomyces sp. Y2F8-2]
MSPKEKAARRRALGRTRRTTRYGLPRSLDVWAHCAPIRLAGCEDVPNETHILRGID